MVAVYASVEAAAAAAGGYVRFDGGGRWRVYATRLVAAGRTVQVVRDRMLAEGFARRAVRPGVRAGGRTGVR